jgi:hypothetical protein
MVSGDVVNGISGDDTILDLVPAAGVEIVITSIARNSMGSDCGLFNGTTYTFDAYTNNNAGMINIKLFINSSIYLRVSAVGIGKFTSYSGIQIK